MLALSWSPGDPAGPAAAADIGRRLDAEGWSPAFEGPDLAVWTRGPCPPPVRDLGGALIVGLCMAQGRTTPFLGPLSAAQADQVAGRLCTEAWGAYAAMIAGPQGRTFFRDPSGGLDLLAWSRGPLRVAASLTGPAPPAVLPPRPALDWRAIAAWCRDPGCAAICSGLEDIDIVAPGALCDPRGGGQTLIWRPSKVAAGAERGAAPPRLVAAVDLAVAGLVAPHARVLGELSGGLDSAIVASAVSAQGLCEHLTGWINYYGDRPEADERVYARAIADHLPLRLEAAAKPLTPLTAADFAAVSQGLRPGFAAVDPTHDADLAARLAASGATALLTGHGGDAVFFQQPTPLIAADQLQAVGVRGLGPASLGDVARFTRRPVWSVLTALAPHSAARRTPYRPQGLVSPWVAALPQAPDPWTTDAMDLPPAKRLQVTALFQSQLARSPSRRGAVAQVLWPLLAQPVVEDALRRSVPELTEGGRRDRALARRAFEGRLPPAVTARRSKGDLTAHHGRVIAASLDALRPLLLEGALCRAGLLDRARLETALRPDHLILTRAGSEILTAAVLESWVRWWQTQVPDSPQGERPRP